MLLPLPLLPDSVCIYNDSMETKIHYQNQRVMVCVFVGVCTWVGLDLEVHKHRWLHQPKHHLSYESCEAILLPLQTSHMNITIFLLPVLHTSEYTSHHCLLFVHFHPYNGRINQGNILILTECMEEEALTVDFLVKYEVPTEVSNDDNFWNVTVCI